MKKDKIIEEILKAGKTLENKIDQRSEGQIFTGFATREDVTDVGIYTNKEFATLNNICVVLDLVAVVGFTASATVWDKIKDKVAKCQTSFKLNDVESKKSSDRFVRIEVLNSIMEEIGEEHELFRTTHSKLDEDENAIIHPPKLMCVVDENNDVFIVINPALAFISFESYGDVENDSENIEKFLRKMLEGKIINEKELSNFVNFVKVVEDEFVDQDEWWEMCDYTTIYTIVK